MGRCDSTKFAETLRGIADTLLRLTASVARLEEELSPNAVLRAAWEVSLSMERERTVRAERERDRAFVKLGAMRDEEIRYRPRLADTEQPPNDLVFRWSSLEQRWLVENGSSVKATEIWAPLRPPPPPPSANDSPSKT